MKLKTNFLAIMIAVGSPAPAMTERDAQEEYCRLGGKISELMVEFASKRPPEDILRSVLLQHYNLGGEVDLDEIVFHINQAAKTLTPQEANDAFSQSCLAG